jgi:thiamine-monophosphate kinase
MDEFDSIAKLFRPLAAAPEARGLLDDAAVLPSRPGFDLVLTKDAIVEGVHFLPSDPLDLVARKLLRVNLSDLAAKGAEPFGYLLAIAWSARCGSAEREAFAQGLQVDQERYGLSLLGGDTVSTPGPLTASATMLGWTPAGRTPSRGGAQPGDGVYVTGVIGDGWLGLQAAQGELEALGPEAVRRLAGRYRLPEPRTDLAQAVAAVASATADVSDGLLADAAHIAEASGVRIELELEAIPISGEAEGWLAGRPGREGRIALATGGDDYEIIFTAGPQHAPAAEAVARRVGAVVQGAGLGISFQGAPLTLDRLGWRHG